MIIEFLFLAGCCSFIWFQCLWGGGLLLTLYVSSRYVEVLWTYKVYAKSVCGDGTYGQELSGQVAYGKELCVNSTSI